MSCPMVGQRKKPQFSDKFHNFAACLGCRPKAELPPEGELWNCVQAVAVVFWAMQKAIDQIIATAVMCLLSVVLSFTLKADTTNSTTPQILTMPHAVDCAPLFYVDDEGNSAGILVDYWRLWSERTGVEIEFQPMAWHKCLAAVQEGEADVVPGVFYTAERDQSFDFSQSFLEIRNVLYVASSSTAEGPEDLSDVSIGVVRGDRATDYLADNFPALRLSIYDSFEVLVRAAATGQVKALAMDRPTARFYLSRFHAEDDFRELRTLFVGKFCAAVAEGEDGLLFILNHGIEKINEEELSGIIEAWDPPGLSVGEVVGKGLLVLVVIIVLAGIGRHYLGLRGRMHERTHQLQTTQQNYEMLIHNASEGIGVYRPDRFIFVNPSMVKITGYSEQELLSRPRVEVVHPDDLPLELERIEKQARGESVPDRFTIRIRTAQGETRWLQVSTAQIEWEGQPAELDLVSDVTAIKEAEEALRLADEHLRLIVEVSPVPVIISRISDGAILYLNDNLAQLIGGDRESLLGQQTPDFYADPNERNRVVKMMQERGRLDAYEVRLKKTDGTEFWALLSIVMTRLKGDDVIIGGVIDIDERRKTEESLRLFRKIFDNSLDGIVLLDAEGNYIESNARHLQFMGLSAEELQGRKLHEIMLAQGEEVDYSDQPLEGGAVRREVTRKLADGTTETIDISAFPIRDEAGTVTNWAGIGRDITERRRASEAMAQRIRYEEGLAGCSRALLEESDMDVALTKALEHLLIASESSVVYLAKNVQDDQMGDCLCTTHYFADEKYRERVEREMPAQISYDAGLQRWRDLMSNGQPVMGNVNNLPDAEKQILAKHGLKSILALPITVEGSWYGFVGFDDCERERGAMVQEIRLLRTAAEMLGGFLEGKKFEKALKVSEERFRSLVEQASDIIFSLAPDGRFTYMSPQFSKATGMPPNACIGLYIWDHLPAEDVEQAREWVAVGMPDDAERYPLGYQFNVQTKDGSWRRFTANVAVLRDDAGEVIEGVGVAHDITEMNKLLKDLEKANQEIRETQTQLAQSEKMASLGLLVAGVAHEINTPVGAINSMHDTEMRAMRKVRREVEEGLEADHPARAGLLKYLQTIEEAGKVITSGTERVISIVRRLRSFARLDESELKTVDIHEGLEDTLALIHNELKHTVTIQRDYGELPPIACYPGQLNQVFLNLLINAKQAIASKGEIRITTRFADNRVGVIFEDSGVGIPADKLPHVFDPGFTTKGVGVGTGLGLAICYQIIRQHEGDIRVESEVGKGTKFTITLPTDLANRNPKPSSDQESEPG